MDEASMLGFEGICGKFGRPTETVRENEKGGIAQQEVKPVLVLVSAADEYCHWFQF
jgi:hypothetical protein